MREWNSVALDRSEGNVQEFALSKAVQIQTVLPKTQFKVEYLAETTQNYTKPKPARSWSPRWTTPTRQCSRTPDLLADALTIRTRSVRLG